MLNNAQANMRLTFESKYILQEQHTASVLKNSGVLRMFTMEEAGSMRNFAGIDTPTADFTALTSKNQAALTYNALSFNNRRLDWSTYGLNFAVDKEVDIVKAVADPTSDLIQKLIYPKIYELWDRQGFQAAVGPVMTGAPNTAGTSTSAATDGVKTVVATSGITEALLRKITQIWINNKYSAEKIRNDAVGFITGSENTAFMGLEKLTNRLWTECTDENKNVVMKLFDTITMKVVYGSDADTTYTNPLIPEASAVRSCPFIMKGGVAGVIGDLEIWVNRNPETYQNSQLIKVNVPCGFMRTRGTDVIILSTTVES
mgnify:FL=1|nr:MAG TPA: hypothetical protein [Caudoviricetes sp.]